MGGLLEPKKLPTSMAGVKSSAKMVAGTGYSALLLAMGVGAAALALPFVARVPVAGRLAAAGVGVLRPAQSRDDGFGGF